MSTAYAAYPGCPTQLSRHQTFRVAREHACLSDVPQATVKHDHPLHADAAAAMWRRTKLECVQVRPNAIRQDAVRGSSLLKELGRVDALRARNNFLHRVPVLQV